MSDLNIQLCPETGICSIIKDNGKKIDLMPFEVKQIKEADGSQDAIKQAIAEIDPDFAKELDSGEINQISEKLK
ncbi:MAG: hypothetical protein DRI44_00775 [Chlamydiae bacterium]|nr:MAG: hypothetical protein DRI44_00775 [Chlamydiota bacterium]